MPRKKPEPEQVHSLHLVMRDLVVQMEANGTKVKGECVIVSNTPTTCPLCGAAIPANTRHQCRRDQ